MGKTIYFTDNEKKLLHQAALCYIEMMIEGDDTNGIVKKELEAGLSRALNKLEK